MSTISMPPASTPHNKGTQVRDYTPPPVSARIGSRARRRRAVLALYLGYPLFVASLWGGSALRHHGEPGLAWAMVVPLAVTVVAMLAGGYILLSRTAINLPNMSDRVLDERQRLVRDRAYRISFRLVSGVLLSAALYMMMALSSGWSVPHTADAGQAIFWGVFVVTTTLPTAVIAWTEPAPREDEAADDLA